jgi:hypothetical protein
LIFYSAEARGYALAVVLVILSTLALLAALADRRVRWWVADAALPCAAMCTHYTAAFPRWVAQRSGRTPSRPSGAAGERRFSRGLPRLPGYWPTSIHPQPTS